MRLKKYGRKRLGTFILAGLQQARKQTRHTAVLVLLLPAVPDGFLEACHEFEG